MSDDGFPGKQVEMHQLGVETYFIVIRYLLIAGLVLFGAVYAAGGLL